VLAQAGLTPKDVDVVAVPMAPVSIFSPARWCYAKRYWYAPDRALDALLNGNRHYRRYVSNIRKMLTSLGFEWGKFEFEMLVSDKTLFFNSSNQLAININSRGWVVTDCTG
jgi:carbamoyltransferase